MKHLDYSHMSGGLVRMMDRFKDEGTLTGDLEADEFDAVFLEFLYIGRMQRR